MIDSTQPNKSIGALTYGQDMRTRSAKNGENVKKEQPAAEDNSDVTLSTLTRNIQKDDSRDVNFTRVEAARAALAADALPLEPEKIAQALVQEIFQFQ